VSVAALALSAPLSHSTVPALRTSSLSLIVIPESWIRVPLVVLNLGIALSVADAGPTTSPPPAGVELTIVAPTRFKNSPSVTAPTTNDVGPVVVVIAATTGFG